MKVSAFRPLVYYTRKIIVCIKKKIFDTKSDRAIRIFLYKINLVSLSIILICVLGRMVKNLHGNFP